MRITNPRTQLVAMLIAQQLPSNIALSGIARRLEMTSSEVKEALYELHALGLVDIRSSRAGFYGRLIFNADGVIDAVMAILTARDKAAREKSAPAWVRGDVPAPRKARAEGPKQRLFQLSGQPLTLRDDDPVVLTAGLRWGARD